MEKDLARFEKIIEELTSNGTSKKFNAKIVEVSLSSPVAPAHPTAQVHQGTAERSENKGGRDLENETQH